LLSKEAKMPYKKVSDLPQAVQDLPQHACMIWMAAFNAAWDQYNGNEQKCAETAWTAVKNKYEKGSDGQWHALSAATRDEAKKAQEARSKKWGIAVKDGGNVTKPSEWANVPDDEFLDPVNYRYPCPDAGQTKAAAGYWGHPKNQEQYSSEEKAIISRRLQEMEKKFMMGDFAKGAGEYINLQAASRLSAAVAQEGDADYGYKWTVQIIEAGPDIQMGAIYPHEVLQAAVPVYEGAKVFALSQGQHANPNNPYGKSVRDLVGWISGVKSNVKGLEGTLNVLKTATWLRDMTVDAWKRGKKDLIGLSHDVLALTVPGSAPKRVEKIVRVDSVDVVYDPIAGGKFLRMAAARAASRKEDNMWKQLLAALKKQRPELKDQIEALEAKGDAVTEEEVSGFVVTAMTGAGHVGQKDEIKEYLTKLMGSLTEVTTKQAQDLVDQATKKFEDTQKLLACASLLVEELENSKLPDVLKARIRKQFSGKVFEADHLRAAIKEEKEIADKLTGSGSPFGVGGLRIEVGEGEPEKLQAACDKLMGADVDEKHKSVEGFRSLRTAYTRLTGDTELRGVPSREGLKLGEAFMQMMRLPAAYSSSSFSFVLGNAMYRRLIKEYNAVNYQEDVLISFYRNAENFKTLEIIQVGYFGDVPDVDPETADYAEITMPTDIEATYAINQKGWILTITRKVIMNDDLKTVTQLVSKMGRAHRRTHARRAWDKIISNANFKGDTTALFHSDHGNLGSVVLTADATGIATLTNRLKAMYAQEEQDSEEGLALIPKYEWVPRDLLEVAQVLNSPWPLAGSVNPHAGRFGQNHERIITNPLFTDTNDWGLIADGNDVELLEAAYINGRREPEFFVADNPIVGQMFVADKIQYKSRHEYEFEIADFRGFDKSVVAGGT
jgi:cation transport regulator ChaB